MLNSCVVYTSAIGSRWQAEAARGGPMGELLMARSLVDGLAAIGADVTVIGSLRAFAAHRARLGFGRLPLGRRPIYFLDPPTLELARRYRLFAARDTVRLLVLDWYGTPPGRARASRLDTAQYLLPYPDDFGWNTFLGFMLPKRPGAAAPKKRQGVVWGKDARYFRGDAAAAVATLASVCELHTTVSGARGFHPGLLPPGVINHGAMEPSAWQALLRESSFVLGLGDPVSGPTALEALAEGCAYLNPRYSAPRLVNDVPELAIDSQHPYAARIGPPFVHTIDLRDRDALVRAAEASFDTAARLTDRAPLEDALVPFTRDRYVERLRALIASRQ